MKTELTYTVKGTRENESERTLATGISYASLTTAGTVCVVDGTWSFTIEGYNNTSKVLSGTSEPTSISSTSGAVSVTLDWVSEATGSVNVKLTFPKGSGLSTVSKVTAGLYNNKIAADSGTEQTIVPESTTSYVTFTQSSVNSGTTKYVMFFLYSSEGTVLGRYTETVFIAAGTTSSAERTLATIKSGGTVTVTLLTDNSAYTGETKTTLSLKNIDDENCSYPLSESSSGVYTANVIKGCKYFLYEGNTNQYVIVTPSSTGGNATVDYCSTSAYVKTALSSDSATTSGLGVILTEDDTTTTSISNLKYCMLNRSDKVSLNVLGFSSVTTMDYMEFGNTQNLECIALPKNLREISESAFSQSYALLYVVMPNSLTSIGAEAFNYCINLNEISIPASVNEIGAGVFLNCKCLNINIDSNNNYYKLIWNRKGIISKNGKTLVECIDYNSSTLTIPETVTVIENGAFGNCISLSNITIPKSVTKIGLYAFMECSYLSSVIFEDGSALKEINYWSFYRCNSLTEITIPKNVSSLDSSSFFMCENLTLTVDSANKNYETIWNGKGIINKDGKTLVECIDYTSTTLTIPNTVTKISDRTFEFCKYLTAITIPNTVTSIGISAFRYATSLTEITIPSSVTSIGRYAFDSCSSLTSVTFADTDFWYYADEDVTTGGTLLTISSTDTAANATLLKSTYLYKFLYKTDTAQ